MSEELVDLLTERDVVRRIWERDGTLWSEDPEVAALCEDRLGWLFLPWSMQEHVPQLQAFTRAVIDDGIEHVVLCGMGGSSLAPEMYAQVFGVAEGHPDLTVVDSTDPRVVGAVSGSLDPQKTLVIVASKSGGTAETDALRRHFTAWLAASVEDPADHLVAITDEGSALEELANEDDWRGCVINPSDVGGRFSALSLFGLVPAALIGVDVATLLDEAIIAASGYRPGWGDDESIRAAVQLGSAAVSGRDKLSFVTSETVDAFGAWVEQLVAESTGKHADDGPVGILPIVNPGVPTDSDDMVETSLLFREDDPVHVDAADHVLEEAHELGGVLWEWEWITAVAAIVMGIEPFDQPDVASAKDATKAVLSEGADRGPADDAAALDELLGSVPADGYVAILSWLPPEDGRDEAVADLAERITARAERPTTIGVGPRYLHSTGQLHKGGPDNGVFVVLEGPAPGDDEDLPIPDGDHSFGTLFHAQAEGDVRALRDRGRRVVRLRVGSVSELASLCSG